MELSNYVIKSSKSNQKRNRRPDVQLLDCPPDDVVSHGLLGGVAEDLGQLGQPRDVREDELVVLDLEKHFFLLEICFVKDSYNQLKFLTVLFASFGMSLLRKSFQPVQPSTLKGVATSPMGSLYLGFILIIDLLT